MKAFLWVFGIVAILATQLVLPQAMLAQSMSGPDVDQGNVDRPTSALVSSVSLDAIDSELLVEYPVPGSPHAISVESPGRVWFTLPQENLIGRLVVISSGRYQLDMFAVPTSASLPYDLVYAAGAVWFSEQQGNKIGRLDPVSGAIAEFAIPTASSTPTGIDVLTGSPTQVWFTERNGDRLGRLEYTDGSTWTVSEYPLPTQYTGAELEDVSIQSVLTVWFTAPGIGYIGRYDPALSRFTMRTDSRLTQPWSIKVAAGGLPVWFTDRAGNQVAAYIPTTISDYRTYSFPVSGSAPYDLVLTEGKVWCTQWLGQQVTQLQPSPASLRSYHVGSETLEGIDADAAGHLWFAESGAMSVGEWRPPYFKFVYLPLAMRR